MSGYVTSAPLANHVRKLIENDPDMATQILLEAFYARRFPLIVEYRQTLDYKTSPLNGSERQP